MNEQVFEQGCLKVVQKSGPYVEVFFDWNKAESLELDKGYYLLQVRQSDSLIEQEWARPNSSGPMHFVIKEGVPCEIRLLASPHLEFEVSSESLNPLPAVDLIVEHEGLHTLVWGGIDWETFKHGMHDLRVQLKVDGKLFPSQSVYDLPQYRVPDRPKKIDLVIEGGQHLFTLKTNYGNERIEQSLKFKLPVPELKLHAYSSIQPMPGWSIRTELNGFWKMQEVFLDKFKQRYPDTDITTLVGEFAFFEDEEKTQTVRQWGFVCVPEKEALQNLLREKGLPLEEGMAGRRILRLEATSAHREAYRLNILEKEYVWPDTLLPAMGLDDVDIQQARRNLWRHNRKINWETSFLELVLLFETPDGEQIEFQRKVAQSLRWDFTPAEKTEKCRVEWILRDSLEPSNRLIMRQSGYVYRDHFPAKLVLKPYGTHSVLAWWDLEVEGVRDAVWQRWNTGLEEVGFYIKMHEEYLGERKRRPDLDQHLIDVFSGAMNTYVKVDPDRTYSAELVAKRYDEEMALTAVSPKIIVPKTLEIYPGEEAGHRRLSDQWHHTSQREVRHLNGHNSQNRAKVLLQLHMHSPNMFRADPFREGFLRNVEWPQKTADGSEVHNPPGEWILKNCLDSWLPLLRSFRALRSEGIDFQIGMDISPPVAYVLTSPRFKDYFSRYLFRVQAYLRKQIGMLKSRLEAPEYIWAAERYLEDVNAVESFYHTEIGKDIIGAFRELELQGFLEITTCTVTHGMPSELESMPDSLHAQVALAGRTHHRIFGDRPRGIWLAENAFFPGVENYLAQEGMHYFFVEAESVLHGSKMPKEEEFNPVLLTASETVAFGRSRLGRLQVWDAEIGYAGHPEFREFHHRHWGMPIKKITSKTSEEKGPYHPDTAELVAKECAHDFYNKLLDKGRELADRHFENIPLITCSYDAELFGHHWSEGPIFLMELLREFYRRDPEIGLVSPSHYLADHPVLPDFMPNPSTWGHESTNVKWADPKVAWAQRELERADGLLRVYLGRAMKGELDDFQKEMVEQMGAELMRAQSSDLTFVIMAGAFEEDMQREILKYLDYFYRLKMLVDNHIKDEDFLRFRQYENRMFPEMKDFYQIRKD